MAILLAGCGGSRGLPAAADPTAALELPAPSQLTKYMSYTPEDRLKRGNEHSGIFPSNRVLPHWINAHFSPNWDLQNNPTTADLAYTAYIYQLLGYSDLPQLHVGWVDPPGPADWWIGMARWDDDVWEWHQGTVTNLIAFSTLEPYISETGNIFLLVMVAGTKPCTLGYLRFGNRLGNWHIETVDASDDVYRFNSLALDSQGSPYIAYHENDWHGLKYAYVNGVLWETEDGITTADDGMYCSLALDSAGLPHISFSDHDSGHLQYYHHDGSWQASDADSSGTVFSSTSLALDNLDQPHIAYNSSGPDELRYTYFSGGLWHPEVVSDEGMPGRSASLVLNEGSPCIAYTDEANKTGHYAWLDGIEWVIEQIDDEVFALGTDLAFDGAGHPHISLFITEPTIRLKHNYFNGSEWIAEEIQQIQHYGGKTGIAIDSLGWIHISYVAQVNGDYAVRYAWHDGNTWQAEVIETCTETMSDDTSLELDPAGRPCISYIFYEPGSSDGILKCAVQVD